MNHILEDLGNMPRDYLSPNFFPADLVPGLVAKASGKKFTKLWLHNPKKIK